MATMNENPHRDDDLYEQIAKRRYEYDYTSPWEHLAPAPRRLLTQAAHNTMEPIIARVRREAKAEALIDAAEDLFYDGDIDRPMYGHRELYDRADRIKKGNSNE